MASDKCFKCGESDHWAKECTKFPIEQDKCNKCGKTGTYMFCVFIWWFCLLFNIN